MRGRWPQAAIKLEPENREGEDLVIQLMPEERGPLDLAIQLEPEKKGAVGVGIQPDSEERSSLNLAIQMELAFSGLALGTTEGVGGESDEELTGVVEGEADAVVLPGAPEAIGGEDHVG